MIILPELADHQDAPGRIRQVLVDPQFELAARQMSGFGGIVSRELADGATARRFAESTRLFTLAESLGGVESLVNYPDAMTHASVRGTELAVPETIVRLSVGIEAFEDLRADLAAGRFVEESPEEHLKRIEAMPDPTE